MFLQAAFVAAGATAPLDVLGPAVMPMTGVAFLLYTFYMVTDPATTPAAPRHQVVFGLSVAAAYGLLMALHVVFGLFFSLTAVTTVRGVGLLVAERSRRRREQTSAVLIPVGVNR